MNTSHNSNLSLDIGQFRYISLKREKVTTILIQLEKKKRSNSILDNIETIVKLDNQKELKIIFPCVESVLKLLNYIYYIFN
jgi:hypothetical protein